jgi:predicted nuclease of predicted toxin-antitoxin system
VRFLLDNDVDVAIGNFLRNQGHDCWSAAECGLSDAEDDDVSVYADNRNAVVISHDKDFAHRRIDRTFGRHIRLSCDQPEALEILAARFTEVIDQLQRREAIVLIVSRDGVRVRGPHWR